MVRRIKSKIQACILLIMIFSARALCQADNGYQVYALRFNESGNIPVRDIAVGTSSSDSVSVCNMFWYLKGPDGRNILVDTGFIDPADTGNSNYERPDFVLKRINVSPSDITDIIITHPHPDHIGGVLLFPGARVWMQREDFLYFVSGKWKKEGSLAEFDENDVRNIIEISLQGRLELTEGDDIEIIPGHDNLVFSRFPEVCKGVVKIGN